MGATASPQRDWLSTDEVRGWLASLPAADAEQCDSCGHSEGPFAVYAGEAPNCHLCIIRKQSQDEWERLMLTELFHSGLEAISRVGNGIMPESVGRAAITAGERFLADWRRS